jgi:hypothetical protein
MPIKVKKKILVLIMSHEYPHYIIYVLVRQKSKKLQQLILMYQIQNILILTSPNCNNLYVYLDQNLTFRLGVILHFCYFTLFIILCPSTHHSLLSQLIDSSDPLTFTTKIPPLNNYLFCFFSLNPMR